MLLGFFKRFLNKGKHSKKLINEEIRALAEAGDWEQLEIRARDILQDDDPIYAESMAFLAYSLQQQNKLEEASLWASKAASHCPEIWLAHFVAGMSYKGLGDLKASHDFLKRALSISPNDKQTLLQYTEVTAGYCGLEAAASEYNAFCNKNEISSDVFIAPVCSVRDWIIKNNLALQELGKEEHIPFKVPLNWDQKDISSISYSLSNKPYIAEINNARIFSHSSLILTPDGTVLSDIGGDRKFGDHVSFVYEKIVLAQKPRRLLLELGGYSERQIETGFLLSGLASDAFGHWLPEFLPKLEYFKQHPDYDKIPIIIDENMPDSHLIHLKRLSNNPIISLKENESILCQNLIVAPSPSFSPVEMLPHSIPANEFPGLSPRALRFLRGDRINQSNLEPKKRLFLARKNMIWRRLLNEAEIVNYLESKGFETIYLEDMGVNEQIEAFESAECIIAPNGSSLLNLIFSRKDVKLLILSQQSLFNWGTFQGPMEELGYSPKWICSDQAVDKEQKHSDYAIPLSDMQNALVSMGIINAEVQ